jgi:hypothetical protein
VLYQVEATPSCVRACCSAAAAAAARNKALAAGASTTEAEAAAVVAAEGFDIQDGERSPGTKPSGAWTTDQTAKFLLARISEGDFYVICPDNEVDRATDNLRMTWTMQDITENRTPLSRWDPDYAPQFEKYLEKSLAKVETSVDAKL